MQLSHAQVSYSGVENVAQGSGSYLNVSSSYGSLTAPTSSSASYDLNFAPGYSTFNFSNVGVTSSTATFTQTASFADGIGQPNLPVTTTFTLNAAFDLSTTSPTGSLTAGTGGYHLTPPQGYYPSSGTVTFTGTYSISGGGQTVTGTFDESVPTQGLTSEITTGLATNDPLVNFSGSGPVYGLSLSGMNYAFAGGLANSNTQLFSGTVGGVNISVGSPIFSASSSGDTVALQALAAPEPIVAPLAGIAMALLCIVRNSNGFAFLKRRCLFFR